MKQSNPKQTKQEKWRSEQKKLGRKARQYFLTDTEQTKVSALIKKMRGKK